LNTGEQGWASVNCNQNCNRRDADLRRLPLARNFSATSCPADGRRISRSWANRCRSAARSCSRASAADHWAGV